MSSSRPKPAPPKGFLARRFGSMLGRDSFGVMSQRGRSSTPVDQIARMGYNEGLARRILVAIADDTIAPYVVQLVQCFDRNQYGEDPSTMMRQLNAAPSMDKIREAFQSLGFDHDLDDTTLQSILDHAIQ